MPVEKIRHFLATPVNSFCDVWYDLLRFANDSWCIRCSRRSLALLALHSPGALRHFRHGVPRRSLALPARRTQYDRHGRSRCRSEIEKEVTILLQAFTATNVRVMGNFRG